MFLSKWHNLKWRDYLKKLLLLVILFVVLLCPALAFSEDSRALDKMQARIGYGGGIAYGWHGVNLEVAPIEYIAFSAGFGFASGDPGWSVGARVYPLGLDPGIRPRLSVYHGVVARIEKPNGSNKKFGVSNAYGAGIDLIIGGLSVDFEAIYRDFNLPKGYVFNRTDLGDSTDGDWIATVGIGFRFH